MVSLKMMNEIKENDDDGHDSDPAMQFVLRG